MIAVIADDLTGAAELAGIGLNHQLKTEVNTAVNAAGGADLLIIATNTRALSADEAKEVSRQVTLQLMKLKPDLIFKKIDSVLRGHILPEIESQLEASGLKRALIIPGNPQHKKTIVNGVYYYCDTPVHQSNYARDPGFPIISSDVKRMLRADKHIHLLKKGEKLPQAGIAIGDISAEEDFSGWLTQIDDHTLVAGAAGLFNALLDHLKLPASAVGNGNIVLKAPRLFVFGSTFYQGKLEVKNDLFQNVPFSCMPPEIINNDKVSSPAYGAYCNRLVSLLKTKGKAIMALNPANLANGPVNSGMLASKMGIIVSRIIAEAGLNELLIEGGATASAVLTQLNINRLCPVQQLSPGVIRMRVADNDQLYVTLKPGSYEWPAQVWN